VTPSKTGYRFIPVNQSYSNVDEDKTLQNYAAIRLYTLTMAVNPSGAGTTSPAAGSSYVYDAGTIVDIEANANANYRFSSWTGAVTNSGEASTTVTMDANKTVTANFIATRPLTVTIAGTGAGSVISNPPGIDCGETCSADFDINTLVTLTATASTGSTFTGWSNGCTGTGTCQVTMDQARSVTATFTLNTYTLTIGKVGEGTVISVPGGIDCGSACSASFDYGTSVTLKPTPASGYSFDVWSGTNVNDLTYNNDGTWSIIMTGPKSLTANFVTGIVITAFDDSYEMAQGAGSLVVSAENGVLKNDNRPDGVSLEAQRIMGTGPLQGTLNFDASGGFSLTSVPPTFVGELYFDYKACDVATSICSEPATVTIAVKTVPTANPDTYKMGLSTSMTVPAASGVLANDGPVGVVLTATEPTSPTGGTLTLNPNGSFTFTQTPAWTGSDSFTYKACDGTICSTPATVTIEESDACLTVAPTSLEQTLLPATTGALDLTLINECDVPVSFNLVESGGVIAPLLRSENFETGVWPPTGWTRPGLSARPWRLTSVSGEVDEGIYAAYIDYDLVLERDDWLITPILDATSFSDLVLSFRAFSNTLYPHATVQVWVLNEAGDKLTDEPLWDMIRDESWVGDPYYRTVLIDLSQFAGEDAIRIGWRYVGIDGQSFGLDNISIGGRANISWITSLSPATGSIDGGEQTKIAVTFDSKDLGFGRYEAILFVRNAPYPVIYVPVTLIVSAEGDFQYYLPLIVK
jgi:hypothetical protein